MSEIMELTQATLKSMLTEGMVYRGQARKPLEEITENGLWLIDSYTPSSDLTVIGTTIPTIALLEVINRGVADVVQRVTDTGSAVPSMYIRINRTGVGWRDWYKFPAFTKVT